MNPADNEFETQAFAPVDDPTKAFPFLAAIETERHDAMWGEGNWVVHEGCPAALEAGQDRAVHHREYHA